MAGDGINGAAAGSWVVTPARGVSVSVPVHPSVLLRGGILLLALLGTALLILGVPLAH